MRPEPKVIVIMGVSGAGKTTLATALARSLGWELHDADDYHAPQSIKRMRRGEALSDAMRVPWLTSLRELIVRVIAEDRRAVLACSALREAHRDALVPPEARTGAVRFVHLDVDADVLHARLSARRGHFAPPELLASQLATLEPPMEALRLDGSLPVAALVHRIETHLQLRQRGSGPGVDPRLGTRESREGRDAGSK